ncbi:hypothetical protein [Rossellomorea vietnamensis]|uniref:hypothetical protein n=1 Tax=Rossellomorea vietnamensis TaxID=218284 RepID=UPI003D2DE0D9
MVKEIEMDKDLIEEFRDKVNEHDFFRIKFQNVEGKNYWNLICSAMDWISVAATGLPNIKLNPKGMGYDHLETLTLMQYILTIDILAESIIQLYRVIGEEGQSYPLHDNREVFNQNKLSDDKYFKHVRAVFSTHPVNLNSLDGVNNGEGERFFASWIARQGFFDHDYNVSLYSNIPEKDKQHFLGINIKNLNEYAEMRYGLLKDLIEKVDNYNNKHIKKYVDSPIDIKENVLNQLEILFRENEIRFGRHYGYGGIINYIYIMMKVDINAIKFNDFDVQLVHDYRDFLVSLIPEILKGLQEMKEIRIDRKVIYYGYALEKIENFLFDGENQPGKSYLNALIKEGPLPNSISINDDLSCLKLILDSLLYCEYNKLGKPITFEEMMGK